MRYIFSMNTKAPFYKLCWLALGLLLAALAFQNAWTADENAGAPAKSEAEDEELLRAMRAFKGGELDSAWQQLQALLSAAATGGDPVKIAPILVTMSEVARKWSEQLDSDKAQKSFQVILDSAQAAKLPRIEVSVLGNRARLHNLTGFPEKARADLEWGLSLAKENGDRPAEIKLRLSLASLFQQIGKVQEANDIYQALLDESGQGGAWDTLKAGCYINLGVISYQQQRFDDAARDYNQALSLLPAQQDALNPGQAGVSGSALNNLAEIAIDTKQFQRAESFLEGARKMRESAKDRLGLASVTHNRAKAAVGQEHSSEARTLYQSALDEAQAMGVQNLQVDCLTGLGLVDLHDIDTAKGRDRLSQAATIARRIADPFRLQRALTAWGDLEQVAGATKEAEALYREAIDQIETLGRSLPSDRRKAAQFWSAHDETFQKLISVLTAVGKVNDALDFTLRRNAFRYDLSAQADSVTSDPQAQAALAEYQKAQQDMANARSALQGVADTSSASGTAQLQADLQKRYSEAQGKFLDMADRLARENPNVYEGLGIHPSRAVLLQGALQQIKGRAAIVTYVLTGNPQLPLVVFIIKNTDLAYVSVAIEEPALARRVRMFHSLVGCPAIANQLRMHAPGAPDWMAEIHAQAGWLYKNLIDAVAVHLQDVDILAVIPDKILAYLPFAALGHETPAGWKWLLEEKTVVYLRGQSLEELTSNLQSGQIKAMAMANADGSLPYTEQEVQAVADAYPGAKVYTGAQASEDKIKFDPNGSNLLHFGTHAVLDPDNAENSHLVLAPSADGSEDGMLTLHEIRRLARRQGAIVTLSACETSISAESVGQELVHLERAFRLIGTRTIIASLWPVDDEATAILMRTFYKKLKDKTPSGQALNQAQILLATDPAYNAPFFWAPFVLVGSWE